MATFTRLNKAETITRNNVKVTIIKYKKAGTKSTFFAPETVDGKRINKVMFARLYDAQGLAIQYINHITK